ncbi:MAG TPA: GIY-YIG nuclease family protein [Rhizomicrobium sp.]|jgi:putative endonuclease|nr:GIY-YIG nuclease family protein [Rhizomicrobium sp.]
MRRGYVYLLASKPYGTLYVGVTNDLSRRVFEHRGGLASGFTKRYGVTRLVWFETHESVAAAIQRETSIKRWKRNWKIDLVNESNPAWRDLTGELL